MKIQTLLPERTPGIPSGEVMPALGLDGEDYVALLEIPAFDLQLPVADEWDSNGLYRGPARFTGSTYEGTLVIGGADHPGQFAFCSEIDLGASVTVTDMTGGQFTYTVARVDRARDAKAQWLQSEEYDLTLFCAGKYSMEYIAVRCVSTPQF